MNPVPAAAGCCAPAWAGATGPTCPDGHAQADAIKVVASEKARSLLDTSLLAVLDTGMKFEV
jgi:hypothetical protein